MHGVTCEPGVDTEALEGMSEDVRIRVPDVCRVRVPSKQQEGSWWKNGGKRQTEDSAVTVGTTCQNIQEDKARSMHVVRTTSLGTRMFQVTG